VPNLNYKVGRRMEYGRRKHWQKRGYAVMRSAGSHGDFDLVSIHRENPTYPVELIQCKVVKTHQIAKAMILKFQKNPPFLPSPHYHQVLEVHIKGTSDVLSATI
jgi:hypothetical protein